MEPPKAIKLPPTLICMPPMVRRMIIAEVYRGVVLIIEPPDKKLNEERVYWS